MNSRLDRLFCGGAAALYVLCMAGCKQARTLAPQPDRVTRSALVSGSLATVQRSVEYRRAELCFERRDYDGALAQIRQLQVSDAGRAPDVRAFLLRQQDICEAAHDGRRTGPPVARYGGGRAPTPNNRGAGQASRTAEQAPKASGQADCGPRALALVCERLGVRTSVANLRRLAGTTRRGTTMAGLEKAARAIGLKAEGVQVDRAALEQLASPAVAWVDGDHFVAVLTAAGDEATIHDPNHTGEEVMKTDELLRRSGGILLALSH